MYCADVLLPDMSFRSWFDLLWSDRVVCVCVCVTCDVCVCVCAHSVVCRGGAVCLAACGGYD